MKRLVSSEHEQEIIAAARNWKSRIDVVAKNQHYNDMSALNSAVMRLANALNEDHAARVTETGKQVLSNLTEQEPCGFAPKLIVDNDK